ncbi:PREDICTED: uncharacterized protein LOC105557982 [Vollenhovia emeryi]|uniref:uncharacterized protein LOC105557982 n=1 Tax=Vollenhovia emeryi TaxID=411798 RepID=UPI0005F49FFF|nr:PREDICTED: uncharacterized protein LOC105557982 [Vollenhovia emeryi]
MAYGASPKLPGHLQVVYHSANDIKVGTLVLISDERYPPGKWPLARVLELHPGPDGLTRVVTVKTPATSEQPLRERTCFSWLFTKSTDTRQSRAASYGVFLRKTCGVKPIYVPRSLPSERSRAASYGVFLRRTCGVKPIYLPRSLHSERLRAATTGRGSQEHLMQKGAAFSAIGSALAAILVLSAMLLIERGDADGLILSIYSGREDTPVGSSSRHSLDRMRRRRRANPLDILGPGGHAYGLILSAFS